MIHPTTCHAHGSGFPFLVFVWRRSIARHRLLPASMSLKSIYQEGGKRNEFSVVINYPFPFVIEKWIADAMTLMSVEEKSFWIKKCEGKSNFLVGSFAASSVMNFTMLLSQSRKRSGLAILSGLDTLYFPPLIRLKYSAPEFLSIPQFSLTADKARLLSALYGRESIVKLTQSARLDSGVNID